MITPRSALKFDLFGEASRQRKIEEIGDPLQTISLPIDFAALVSLVDGIIERKDARKGGKPAYPTEVMVRILVLKRLYNLSDEQMGYQLLDRRSYQRFCSLEDSMNVPERNTIWRFGERLGVDGATALLQAVDGQLHRQWLYVPGWPGHRCHAGASALPAHWQERSSKAQRRSSTCSPASAT